MAAFIFAGGAAGLFAHDLFFKLDGYFVPTNATVRALLLNGTFTTSEAAVARNRIADLSLVGPAGRTRLDTSRVVARGESTEISLRTGGEGTYVLGLAVRPRTIALSGSQFADYLREEGLDDVLAERARRGALADSARERYAKHVKAVFQVGGARSDHYATVLGYQAEVVPLDNPYDLRIGAPLRVRCLVNGRPAVALTVLAGGTTVRGSALPESRTVSDGEGLATIRLTAAGTWYVKFIRMQPASEPGIDYVSRWATLTFEVR